MSLSRRELLQAFLGTSAALAACRRSGASRPRIPDGQIIGHGQKVGHKIRDLIARGETIEPPADGWRDVDIAIVGGGMSGLSAAWRLMGSGLENIALLEMESGLGGTAKSGRTALGSFPWGAHYITAPMSESRALIRLLNEMDVLEGRDSHGQPTVAERYICRDPKERLFYYGRWYEGIFLHAGASKEAEKQYDRFEEYVGRLASTRDGRGRRVFALPSAKGSDDAEWTELDRLSMSEWMARNDYTTPRVHWYVDYACRDDYGLRLEDTSAWAALQYYAARVPRYGAEYQSVITWPEGNGRLVTHFAERLGERALTDWAVADVRPVTNPDGSSHIAIVGLTEDGERAVGIRAHQVIFAAPQFLARHLIRDYRERPPAHLSAFQYGPWMVANLHLKGRLSGRGFETSWDNVLYESPSLGYVVSTHQRGLDHGPTIITYYYPLLDSDPRVGRRRLLQAGYEEWADVVLTDLERAHPNIRALTTRMDIMRWGHAMIQPRPGFVWGKDRRLAARPYRNIHFAHSDLSGIALFEEALDQGVRAAEEVMGARGQPYRTWR